MFAVAAFSAVCVTYSSVVTVGQHGVANLSPAYWRSEWQPAELAWPVVTKWHACTCPRQASHCHVRYCWVHAHLKQCFPSSRSSAPADAQLACKVGRVSRAGDQNVAAPSAPVSDKLSHKRSERLSFSAASVQVHEQAAATAGCAAMRAEAALAVGALPDEPMPQHTHVHAVVEAYPHQHSDALRASLQQSLKLGDAFVRPASARVAERSRSGSMHVPVAEIEGMRDVLPADTSGQQVTYFRMQKMRGEAGVWAALPADYKLYYLLPDDDATQARLTIVVRFC